MSTEEELDTFDTSSITTGGVGYNIGSPSLLRNSFDSISNFSLQSEANNKSNKNSDVATNGGSSLGPNAIYELVASNDNKRKNKLSILVNNKTTKITLGPPTVKDIPQVKLSKFEKIENSSFDEYIDNISSEFKVFEKNQALTSQTLKAFVSDTSGAKTDDVAHVPPIFFDPHFRLDDPRFFYKVLQAGKDEDDDDDEEEVIESDSQGHTINSLAKLSDNSKLQEKLSNYLDIVEIHLIEEISKSSSSFFSTFNDLSKVAETSKNCFKTIDSLKEKYNDVQQNEIAPGINVLRKVQKSMNVLKLQESMIQINLILKIADFAQVSFYKGNYCESLIIIDFSKGLIRGDLSEMKSFLNSDEKRYLKNVPFILQLIEKVESFPNKLLNVSQIKSLVHLEELFQELVVKVSRSLNNFFIDYIVEDLNGFYSKVGTLKSFQRLLAYPDNNLIPPRSFDEKLPYNVITEQVSEDLSRFVYGLVKSNTIFEVFRNLEERLITDFKSIIKNYLPTEESTISRTSSQVSLNTKWNMFQLLPNSDSDTVSNSSKSKLSTSGSTTGNGGNSSNQRLATLLRQQTPKEFEIMLVNIYTNLAECLHRLSGLQKFLLDISLDTIEYLPVKPNQEDVVLQLDMNTTIAKLIDILQKRMFKIINIRNDLISSCSYKFFVRFFGIHRVFLLDMETISSNAPTSYLSKYLNKQVNDFYIQYTQKLKSNVISCIEKDIWKDLSNLPNGGSFRSSAQLILNEFSDFSQDKLPDSWSNIVHFDDYIGSLGGASEPQDDSKASETNGKNVRNFQVFVDVDSENQKDGLIVSSSVVKTLEYLKELIILHLILGRYQPSFPFVLIDMVRLVSARIKQQILGANAVKTTELKHITAKHLSISSQNLELLITLMPKLQKCITNINKTNLKKPVFKRIDEVFRSSTNDNVEDITIEEEFTNIVNLLKDHQNDVFIKLVSIMRDRAQNHSIELSKLDFSEPIKGAYCHKYMESLVKETLTISKVLTKYLSEGQYLQVLSEIFNSYKVTFSGALKKLKFKDAFEKMNMMKDIDYFRVKMSDIPGYGECGTILWETVNNIETVEDMEMEKKMQLREQQQKEQAEKREKEEREIKEKEQKEKEKKEQEKKEQEKKEQEKKEEVEEQKKKEKEEQEHVEQEAPAEIEKEDLEIKEEEAQEENKTDAAKEEVEVQEKKEKDEIETEGSTVEEKIDNNEKSQNQEVTESEQDVHNDGAEDNKETSSDSAKEEEGTNQAEEHEISTGSNTVSAKSASTVENGEATVEEDQAQSSVDVDQEKEGLSENLIESVEDQKSTEAANETAKEESK